ncbi:hypothetical protein EYC80_003363 [Monilinia laxa]|uniref:Uncharacterized protein n=1 Tax=Monilinia laxa TaxID=61186 RepID=A0A5N6KEU9_MONLA|nr:hypothetical protein EYC80_003363 [Monilinia laxa]
MNHTMILILCVQKNATDLMFSTPLLKSSGSISAFAYSQATTLTSYTNISVFTTSRFFPRRSYLLSSTYPLPQKRNNTTR